MRLFTLRKGKEKKSFCVRNIMMACMLLMIVFRANLISAGEVDLESGEIYQMYMDVITEKEEEIRAFEAFQPNCTEGVGDGAMTGQLALCDVWGDEKPELFVTALIPREAGYMSSSAEMNIYTYKNGTVESVFTKEYIVYADPTDKYYLFQVNGDNGFYEYMNVDSWYIYRTLVHYSMGDDGTFQKDYELIRSEGDELYGTKKYLENNEQISFEMYEEKLEEILSKREKSIAIYTYFTDEAFGVYDTVEVIGKNYDEMIQELQMLQEQETGARESNGFYYAINADGTATIQKAPMVESADLVIPETLDGYPVTGIGDEAFSCIIEDRYYERNGCVVNILSIPATVTNISKRAFCNSNITTFQVDVNNPVYAQIDGILFNKVEKSLVEYPSDRKTVAYQIPDGVLKIESYAFDEVDKGMAIGLISLEIPDSVKEISAYAFYGNCFLEFDNLPENLEKIGEEAFFGMNKSIVIPANVSEIGVNAFVSNRVQIDENNPNYTIDNEGLIDKRTSTYSQYVGDGDYSYQIPEGIGTIADKAFSSEDAPNRITVPSSVTEIGAFSFCNVISIQLSEGLVRIGNNAFSNSEYLSEITIPETVAYIGSGAFEGCTALRTVNLPETMTELGSRAFYGSDIRTIVIPNGITELQAELFAYCSDLTTIEIPESVTQIDESVFEGCSSLVTIQVAEGSYAESWVLEHGFQCQYENSLDWLTN